MSHLTLAALGLHNQLFKNGSWFAQRMMFHSLEEQRNSVPRTIHGTLLLAMETHPEAMISVSQPGAARYVTVMGKGHEFHTTLFPNPKPSIHRLSELSLHPVYEAHGVRDTVK
uniref:Uncharacterized protein n=1 Tax=Anguilla anguilla TaxID=7936 RepID=A0A0E9Y1R5_ANGAN